MPLPSHLRCSIDRLWDGAPLPGEEIATLDVAFGSEETSVALAAPYHGDPPPPGPAGPTEGLWEYEVVELFLLGHDGYLEIEMGPHGHYLVIEFAGRREARRRLIPLDYRVTGCDEARWTATAVLPNALLPARLSRFNACRIHGTGRDRRYLSVFPLPGETPNFHRLECFGPVVG